MADLIWFLLLHCFIGIMIWLISSIAPLFYCNFDSADFFYFTCFTAIMIRLVLFDFYHTTVLLQIWFRSSLLSHHCFIAIMIWLISSVAPLFYCNYDLADFCYGTTLLLQFSFSRFPLLHHFLIGIMIWLISSIAALLYSNFNWADLFYPPLFCWYYELPDFFDCSTVLLWLWICWFLLLHDYFIAIVIGLFFSIPPPF